MPRERVPVVASRPPALNRTGAVSPAMRAIPRITAVIRPARAVGSTTRTSTLHSGAPRASAASCSDPGTMATTSSAARVTMGSIMTASASAAAKPDLPL